MISTEQEQRRIDKMVERVIDDPPSVTRSFALLTAECAQDILDDKSRATEKLKKFLEENGL